ncbi:MAG TPA: helix-turn-helix domain-containing protein [Burkholderiales bacterium]
MHGLDIEINVLRDGFFPYGLLSAHLGDCVFDIGEVGAAVTVAGCSLPHSVRLLLPLQRGDTWFVNGLSCDPGQLAIFHPGAETFAFTSGPVRWAALQVPIQQWEGWCEEFGAAPRRASGIEMMQLSPPVWHRLRQSLSEAAALLLDHPHAAETPSIRSALRHGLVESFAHAALQDNGGAPVPGFLHARVVRAAEDFLHAHPDLLMLHVADLCRAAAVSERTLRNAFNEAFGMGPIRYLRIRRLNQVRRLLLDPQAVITSVTEAATRFEFFDLGRFARDYRHLFGEKPSETWARLRGARGVVAAA